MNPENFSVKSDDFHRWTSKLFNAFAQNETNLNRDQRNFFENLMFRTNGTHLKFSFIIEENRGEWSLPSNSKDLKDFLLVLHFGGILDISKHIMFSP